MLKYKIKIYPNFTGTEGESTYQTEGDLKGLIEIDIEPDKFVDDDFFAFEGKRAKLKVVPVGAFAEDILNKMNSQNMLQKQVPVPREGNEITTETVPTPYIDCRVEIFANNTLVFVGIPDMSGYTRDYKSGEATIELLSIYGLFFENIEDLSDLRIFNEQLTTPNPGVGELLGQAIQYAASTPIPTGIDVGGIATDSIQIDTPTRYYASYDAFPMSPMSEGVGSRVRYLYGNPPMVVANDKITISWAERREGLQQFIFSFGSNINAVLVQKQILVRYVCFHSISIDSDMVTTVSEYTNYDGVQESVDETQLPEDYEIGGERVWIGDKHLYEYPGTGYRFAVEGRTTGERNWWGRHGRMATFLNAVADVFEQRLVANTTSPSMFSQSMSSSFNGLNWHATSENSNLSVNGILQSTPVWLAINEGGGADLSGNTLGLFNPDKHNFKDFIRTLLTISGKYMFFKNGRMLDFSKQISFSATESIPLVEEQIISLKGKNSFRNLSKEFRDANFAETGLHWLVRLLIFWYRGQVGNIVQAIDLETLQTGLNVGDIVSHDEMVMYVNSVERKEDTLRCELLQINGTSEQKTLDKIPTNKLEWLTEVNSNDIKL